MMQKEAEKVEKSKEKKVQSSQKSLSDALSDPQACQNFHQSIPWIKPNWQDKDTTETRQMEQWQKLTSPNLPELLDVGFKPKGENTCMLVDQRVVWQSRLMSLSRIYAKILGSF